MWSSRENSAGCSFENTFEEFTCFEDLKVLVLKYFEEVFISRDNNLCSCGYRGLYKFIIIGVIFYDLQFFGNYYPLPNLSDRANGFFYLWL